jgi:hypothetical protein
MGKATRALGAAICCHQDPDIAVFLLSLSLCVDTKKHH